jgi:hypothetical protein
MHMHLAASQVRCARPTQRSQASCQVRPTVFRTQEYPEAIELVISENPLDTDDILLSLQPSLYNQFCGTFRPPFTIDNNGRVAGSVQILLAP